MTRKTKSARRTGALRLATLSAITVVLPAVASAATYTYTYTGPAFPSSADNVTISLTTQAPLAPSAVYTTLPAGAYGTIEAHAGTNSFSIPIQVNGFEVNTDANGNIASWDIFSDVNNLTATTPMSGRDYQVYSMNTLSAAVPIPAGVTGRYSYDQATIVDYYKSCTGIAGCTLAGNGQPYVYRYGANSIPAGGGVGTGIWATGAWVMAVNTGTPTCQAPVGKYTTGMGKVTAVGPNYIVVKRTTISWDDCTTAKFGKPTVTVGQTATYKAYGNIGSVEATDLSVK